MRRDSIFYALFKQSPSLLFELLDEVPATAIRYRFESVAVKEPTFTIDGVFLPPETEPPGTVFFAEVQMQKDDRLYERLFTPFRLGGDGADDRQGVRGSREGTDVDWAGESRRCLIAT
jgi:predicted transposase YdaD